MSKKENLQLFMQIIDESGPTRISFLAKQLGVSGRSIRRYAKELPVEIEDAEVKRVHPVDPCDGRLDPDRPLSNRAIINHTAVVSSLKNINGVKRITLDFIEQALIAGLGRKPQDPRLLKLALQVLEMRGEEGGEALELKPEELKALGKEVTEIT